jgi:2-methylcitrate dehydratase PrpD
MFDLRREAAEPLLERGARWKPSLQALVAAVDVVIASLPTPAVVEQVVWGTDGLLATIAGARADGCETALRLQRALGGRPEATVLLHGGKLPAQDAAFVNAVMARALDFCDALPVGPHAGSAVIPAAMAASELSGGCTGRDFMAAVAVGTEVAAWLNLSDRAYDGFDPTGICVPLGAAAAAARLLHLDEQQTANTLGLALNVCGGSFQSHIDGSLGVRFVEGNVAARRRARGDRARRGPRHAVHVLIGWSSVRDREQSLGQRAVQHPVLCGQCAAAQMC